MEIIAVGQIVQTEIIKVTYKSLQMPQRNYHYRNVKSIDLELFE